MLKLQDPGFGTRRYSDDAYNQQTSDEIKMDDAEAIQDMVRRGNEAGKEHFAEVRSRFFDGQHVEVWERF